MSKRVPAELHHELAEYASLLRALRVRDAMDVTKHITQPNPFSLTPAAADDVELNSDDDLPDDDVPPGPLSALSPTPSGFTSVSRSQSPRADKPRPMSAKARGKQRAVDPPAAAPKKRRARRDNWTRWPLLLDDVLKPEWSLEDEVAVIVARVMKGRAPPVFPDVGPQEDGEPLYAVPDLEYDEEDPDPPFYVPYITAVVANYLSTVLTALACLIPARTAGFQNRIEPLGWRTVIDVLVACAPSEFVNPKIVENVISRMEAIYGPSIIPLEGEKSTSMRAVERINAKAANSKKFNARVDEEAAKYWSKIEPKERQLSDDEFSDSSRPRKRRKKTPAPKTRKPRKPRKTKEPAIEDTGPEQQADVQEQETTTKPKKRRPRKTKEPEIPDTTAGGSDQQTDMQETTTNAAGPSLRPDTTAGGSGQHTDMQETPTNATTTTAPAQEEEAAGPSLRRGTRVRVARKFNFPTEDVFMD